MWELTTGDSPLMAVALHNGHFLSPAFREICALDDVQRLREEDPHTGVWTQCIPNRVVALRSRFEADLNRPRELALYRTPEQAWGLTVWREEISAVQAETAMDYYDGFYAHMELLFEQMTRRWGRFVVLDLHAYNGRRSGPDAPWDNPQENPEINIGTGTMNRTLWTPLVDHFIESLRRFHFLDRRLDVRENIKFKGGELTRWSHERFPDSACVIAVEVKKFFMDEWTGELDPLAHQLVGAAIASTTPVLLDQLSRMSSDGKAAA